MSKELKLPLNEMLKEQERIAIKAIVATAKSTITDTGTNLKATLESDAQDLKNYDPPITPISRMVLKASQLKQHLIS